MTIPEIIQSSMAFWPVRQLKHATAANNCSSVSWVRSHEIRNWVRNRIRLAEARIDNQHETSLTRSSEIACPGYLVNLQGWWAGWGGGLPSSHNIEYLIPNVLFEDCFWRFSSIKNNIFWTISKFLEFWKMSSVVFLLKIPPFIKIPPLFRNILRSVWEVPPEAKIWVFW